LNEHKTLSKFSVLSLETIRDFTFFINKWVKPISISKWDSTQPPVW
jgi:hypothetical protein